MTISTLSPFMAAAFTPGERRGVGVPVPQSTPISPGTPSKTASDLRLFRAELRPGGLAAEPETHAPAVREGRDEGEAAAAFVLPPRPAPHRRQGRAVRRLDDQPLRRRVRPQLHRRPGVL